MVGTPTYGWFTMEHPIKMHDLGVPPFQETSIHIVTSNYLKMDWWCWVRKVRKENRAKYLTKNRIKKMHCYVNVFLSD